LRVLDSLREWFLDIDVATNLQRRSCERRMGDRRRTDVHDVRSFSNQQFFGSAVTLDPRHDAFHRSLGDIRGICHRDQLSAGASQDRTGMMLGMAASAEESYTQWAGT
jgi:hypothetical protein